MAVCHGISDPTFWSLFTCDKGGDGALPGELMRNLTDQGYLATHGFKGGANSTTKPDPSIHVLK
jgi:hypothetical protein